MCEAANPERFYYSYFNGDLESPVLVQMPFQAVINPDSYIFSNLNISSPYQSSPELLIYLFYILLSRFLSLFPPLFLLPVCVVWLLGCGEIFVMFSRLRSCSSSCEEQLSFFHIDFLFLEVDLKQTAQLCRPHLLL